MYVYKKTVQNEKICIFKNNQNIKKYNMYYKIITELMYCSSFNPQILFNKYAIQKYNTA